MLSLALADDDDLYWEVKALPQALESPSGWSDDSMLTIKITRSMRTKPVGSALKSLSTTNARTTPAKKGKIHQAHRWILKQLPYQTHRTLFWNQTVTQINDWALLINQLPRKQFSQPAQLALSSPKIPCQRPQKWIWSDKMTSMCSIAWSKVNLHAWSTDQLNPMHDKVPSPDWGGYMQWVNYKPWVKFNVGSLTRNEAITPSVCFFKI